jgi:hypothetical protein
MKSREEKESDRIKGLLIDIKLSGSYKCKHCGKKKFVEAAKPYAVKCVNGHKESATANTAFDGGRMPLSKAMDILIDIQDMYHAAERDAWNNYYQKGFDKYGVEKPNSEDFDKPRIPIRMSAQELADIYEVQKHTVEDYLERLKNWLPKKYQRKEFSRDEWVAEIKTAEGRKTQYAIFNLLFDGRGDMRRTESDILNLLVLKKPEDSDD